MQLKCGACGTPLRGRDVDIAALRARCSKCGWQLGGPSQGIYRKPEQIDIEDLPTEELPARVPLPPLPSFVTVKELSHPARALEIVVRNNRGWRTLFLQGVLVAYLVMTAGTDLPLWVVIPTFVFMSWLLGALFSNNRHMIVGADAITVRYEPFPFPSKRIDVGELEQLWVDEVEEYRGDESFRLRARVRSGRDINLVRQLDDPLAALHLERRIEEHLGIVDKPVSGELYR